MKKEIKEKIKATKALQGKSVEDVLRTPEFAANVAAYLREQRALRQAVRDTIHKQNPRARIPAHTVDRMGYLNEYNFAEIWIKISQRIIKKPKSEREYIDQLGMLAYNKTIADFVIAEFPELKDEFYPKKQSN